jgi:hypothetical protein
VARAVAIVIESAEVACPRISSTSVMSGTGFMKCIPSTLSGRLVAAPSVVIEIDDVLDVRMTPGGTMTSSSRNRPRFTSTSSATASTT